MAVHSLTLGAPLTRLLRRFEHAPWTALAEAAARAGYVARGVVYLSIGTIALLAALDLSPRAAGVVGALEAWAEWPLGLVLLWLIGLGLYAFAAWRGLQAVFDVDHCGRSARGVLSRAGQAVSGLVYGGTAVSVFGLIDAAKDLREVDDGAATHEAVTAALQLPLGGLLVCAVGLFVMGAGVGSIARAVLVDFGRGLDCKPQTRSWARWLARIGYFGRGVALLPVGVVLFGAGLHARASEAEGLGGALDLLEQQPFGDLILSLTGVGLIAFGLFAMVEGWLRRMRLSEAVA